MNGWLHRSMIDLNVTAPILLTKTCCLRFCRAAKRAVDVIPGTDRHPQSAAGWAEDQHGDRGRLRAANLHPQLISLYEAGLFPFDKLVRKYDFADINEAFADSQSAAFATAWLSSTRPVPEA